MARWREPEDEWDDEDDSDDAEFGLEGGDDDGLTPCPHCREPVPEDVARCPYCETYLSDEDDAPPHVKPWWVVVGVVLCLAIVYLWIVQP